MNINWEFELCNPGDLLEDEVELITEMISDRHAHLEDCDCEVGLGREMTTGAIWISDAYTIDYHSIVTVLFGRGQTMALVERTFSNGGIDVVGGSITYTYPELEEEEVEAE